MKREVGMRFDLTVPFARFAARFISASVPHSNGITWAQSGVAKIRSEAYREFMQCDFDTIGTTSAISDLETVLVVTC